MTGILARHIEAYRLEVVTYDDFQRVPFAREDTAVVVFNADPRFLVVEAPGKTARFRA